MENCKLKVMRKKQGMTQTAIALKVGISRMTYYLYESGKCVPPVSTAIRIAKALDAPVEELFPEWRRKPEESADDVQKQSGGQD